MIRLLAAPVLVMSLLCAGCEEEPNLLEGSVSQNFDLDFDDVRFVRINGDTYQLEYLLTLESGGQNVICKIVFDEPEGGIPLETDVDIVANNGIIERIAGDGDFPLPDSAIIRFFEFNEPGDEPGFADGEFAITFEDGKTLNGNFEVALEDVDL
jgi:hypothetical protein